MHTTAHPTAKTRVIPTEVLRMLSGDALDRMTADLWYAVRKDISADPAIMRAAEECSREQGRREAWDDAMANMDMPHWA